MQTGVSDSIKYILIYLCKLVVLTGCMMNAEYPDNEDKLDWPVFRGDACLSGYTELSLPEKPVLQWMYRSEARTVSSPIVYNGTTYWCDRSGLIRGVDIKGKLSFEYDLQTTVEASPMIYDSTLFIGRADGFLSAISLSKKDTIWNFKTSGQITASPNKVKFEGKPAILAGSYNNFLYCIDSKNGQEIARFKSGYYLKGAVAVRKKSILFGGCDSWLRIVNGYTGLPSDSLLLDDYIPASPAVMGNYCYVGDYSGNIYELYLEKGKIIRHKKMLKATQEKGSFVSVPAVTAETVYILSGDRYLYSIDRKESSINWKYILKGNTGESSPVVCKDKIIVCTKTGIITILDAKKGKLLWEYDTSERIVGSPAVIKNYFFILTTKGSLFCFGKV